MTEQYRDISAQIVVVLVETSHPANIGSVARAMKTMGLTQLRLVAPEDFPSARAVWLAAGADDLLERAQVFSSFEEAIADCHFVVGTSARLRGLPWPHVPPRDAAGAILNHARHQHRCALVFGRESSGLNNEALQACHLHTLIPGNPEYCILNLAQAVQVLAYELYTQWLIQTESCDVHCDDGSAIQRSSREYPSMPWDETLATREQLVGLYEHLLKSLSDIGFIEPFNESKIWPRLHRMFQRQRLDCKEVSLLRGLCSHLEQMAAKSTSSSLK